MTRLEHFVRGHITLTIALVLATVLGILVLAGLDSDVLLYAFAGLVIVYFALALIDLRDEFRRLPDDRG